MQSQHVSENRLAQAAFGTEHMMHELGEHRSQIALGVTEFTDDPGLLDALHLDEHVLLGREVEIERSPGHARIGNDRTRHRRRPLRVARSRSAPRRSSRARVSSRRASRTPPTGDPVAHGARGDSMEAPYAASLTVVNDGRQ